MTGTNYASSTPAGSGNMNIPQGGGLLTKNSDRLKMPMPGDRNAPTFAPEKPEELGRFFDRMEDWFIEEGLTDDAEMKKRTVKYLDADSEVQWKALTKFSNGTFEEFKAEVISYYPAAEDVLNGSIAALKRKIKRIGLVKADERDKLLSLKRVMTAEISKLKRISPPIHTNRELVDLFLSQLTPEFANQVASKLSIHRLVDYTRNNSSTPRHEEDMYDIEDVMKMATQTSLEQANPFGKFLLETPSMHAATNVMLEEAVARLTESMKMQAQFNQSLEQRMEGLLQVINEGGNTQNQGFGLNNQAALEETMVQVSNTGNLSSPGQCFYCDKKGHRSSDCKDALRHLMLGWIKEINGHLRLPDGSKLPRDSSKSKKEIIDEMYGQQPGAIERNVPSSNSGWSDMISLMHIRAGTEEKDECLRSILELVQSLGTERATALLLTEVQALDDEEWRWNFE